MILDSPLIESITWGEVRVEGFGSFRDVKLFPGGCREWDWTETGTHHTPGIQLTDISEILSHGAVSIILSKGMLNRLKIAKEIVNHLKSEGLTVYTAETNEAVKKYNQLVQAQKAVGALIHSTC